LHLESENLFKKDYVTLEKLLDEREPVPQNIIGLMNVKDEAIIDELIKEAKKMYKIKNTLLIFRTISASTTRDFVTRYMPIY
jgi:hypothetical protein